MACRTHLFNCPYCSAHPVYDWNKKTRRQSVSVPHWSKCPLAAHSRTKNSADWNNLAIKHTTAKAATVHQAIRAARIKDHAAVRASWRASKLVGLVKAGRTRA